MLRTSTLHKVLISSLVVLLHFSQAGRPSPETDFWAGNEPGGRHSLDLTRKPAAPPTPRQASAAPTRPTNYYLADRVINNNDFAKLANWGINTAIVDFDVNGSAADWRAVFTSAAASGIDIVIWPSDWNDPRPNCGWEAPYPRSPHGNIQKVKPLLDVASQYTNFIGIVNAHESFWTCDMSFDEMAGLKDQLKAYALSKGRAIRIWNYIDNLYDTSMLPDSQIGRIMDVAVTWQHCAGNVEGTCNTSSSTSALNMILNDRKRIKDSGARVELVYIMQTFTTGGYSTRFTLTQLQDYSCQFLNTSALDGFGFYTWHAGWWSDLHSWPDLQPALPYIYSFCTTRALIISGNAGAAGVKLSYMDGAAKTATSRADGSYSFAVSYNWSGTVTPSHPCFTFSPPNHSYTNVTTNQTAQDYTASLDLAAGCAEIDVLIRGVPRGSYGLLPGASTRTSFAGLDSGPVGIVSTNAVPLIGAERVLYEVGGVNTSFSEMMGMPAGQVDTVYWLPWYNSVSLNTQLRIANVSNTDGTVQVTIGTQNMGSFPLAAGTSTRRSFPSIDKGPVKIESNVNIVASERVLYRVNGIDASFSEMMAIPNKQLDTTYWLPWYNDVSLDTQLRIANVGPADVTVHVTIGGVPVEGSPFTVPVDGSIHRSFPGIDKGPVKIESNQPVVVAERVLYKISGVNTSFSELMALPNGLLDTTYWLPWYNNVSLDTQLRIANVGLADASVQVTIGGSPLPGSPFTIPVGASKRLSFAGIDKGPVKIESDQPIVAAERVIYEVSNIPTSFSEMMGLPDALLDVTYWLPWYNNKDLDTQLRFGMP